MTPNQYKNKYPMKPTKQQISYLLDEGNLEEIDRVYNFVTENLKSQREEIIKIIEKNKGNSVLNLYDEILEEIKKP